MNTAREFTVRLQELLRRERLALADFAREVFGDAWMDRYTRNPRFGPPRSSEAPA